MKMPKIVNERVNELLNLSRDYAILDTIGGVSTAESKEKEKFL